MVTRGGGGAGDSGSKSTPTETGLRSEPRCRFAPVAGAGAAVVGAGAALGLAGGGDLLDDGVEVGGVGLDGTGAGHVADRAEADLPGIDLLALLGDDDV